MKYCIYWKKNILGKFVAVNEINILCYQMFSHTFNIMTINTKYVQAKWTNVLYAVQFFYLYIPW
jgi:hypothetical protein